MYSVHRYTQGRDWVKSLLYNHKDLSVQVKIRQGALISILVGSEVRGRQTLGTH